MPAVIQAQWFGASAALPTGVNAETGVTWNRQDTQAGTTPIPIPTTAGVNYSFLKVVQLVVTGTFAGGTIDNRSVRVSAPLPTGLGMHRKVDSQANWGTTFNQQAGTKAPIDTTGVNAAGSAPSGYVAVTTAASQYDNTSQSTTATGLGTVPLLGVLLAVDATFTGSPGSATLGDLILGYDEH